MNGGKRDRKPLEWKDEDTIVRGSGQVRIQSARLDNGRKIYSYAVTKVPREEGRKLRFHMRREDIGQLLSEEVLAEIDNWVQADRAEDGDQGYNRGRKPHMRRA